MDSSQDHPDRHCEPLVRDDLTPEERLERVGAVQVAVKAISGKWKWEIIASIVEGPKRFNELRRLIPGVTQHMLAAQLRDLESDGIVLRRSFAEMPPRVEYELTPAGRALRPVAEALFAWASKHRRD